MALLGKSRAVESPLPHHRLPKECVSSSPNIPSSLAKLLKDEIKQRGQRKVVQSRAFSEMLQKTLTAYPQRGVPVFKIFLRNTLQDSKVVRTPREIASISFPLPHARDLAEPDETTFTRNIMLDTVGFKMFANRNCFSISAARNSLRNNNLRRLN